MTNKEKAKMEGLILYVIEHYKGGKVTTQSQIIEGLKSYIKRLTTDDASDQKEILPIECTQSQMSKLLKEFNITKIDGKFKQIKNKKLYDYFHEHSYIFDNDKKVEDVITFTNENIIHIKLKNDVAKEGCRLINETFDFKVIAHSSYKVITIFSVDENMLSFFDEIDKININSKFHDYYNKLYSNINRITFKKLLQHNVSDITYNKKYNAIFINFDFDIDVYASDLCDCVCEYCTPNFKNILIFPCYKSTFDNSMILLCDNQQEMQAFYDSIKKHYPKEIRDL